MDQFDRKLLALVQKNNRQTNDTLGKLVGLSPAACHRRLKQLRDKGTIQRDVALVSPEADGYSLTLIVQVTLEKEHGDLLDEFKQRMCENPQVTQCYYVTGTSDFIMIVLARDMQDYDRFTRAHFFGNPNIQRFETNVTMSTVKYTTEVPIDQVDDAQS